MHLLDKLCMNEKNLVYIITGRDRLTMQKWLGELGIGLSCEHGCFLLPKKPIPQKRRRTESWMDIRQHLDLGWKEKVRNIFSRYAEETAGSFVESKEITICWHYRNVQDTDFANQQKEKLLKLLREELQDKNVEIIDGKKVIEVKPKGIDKGEVVQTILKNHPEADFVLCIGDDTTDEDMFRALQKTSRENQFSIVVENKSSSGASFYFENQLKVIDLLEKLTTSVSIKKYFLNLNLFFKF